MALQTANPPTINGAQLVGNAFVEQYYHILHHSPELVYRFYQDISVLSRPDANGAMMSVTTMQGINEKICSLDYKNYKAEIKTADALLSYKDGVTVLVTGSLTGKDNLRRKFSQSFFLAPQDNGYFVLNDVFRYVEDGEPLEIHPVDVVDDVPVAPLASAPEPTHVLDPPAADPATSLVEDQNVVEKAVDPVDQEQVVTEKEIDVESQSHANGNDIPVVIEAASSSQEDAPKQSYASIVKVTKGSSGPTEVYIPTTVKTAHKKAENQSVGSAAPAPAPVPEASAPGNIDAPENSDADEEVEGHSIYIRNLPLNVTVPQLELEFNKFGPIKPGGVQVRNHKQGYCFGFVEFLSFDSMDKAIQASPVAIGGRQAVVEIKKTSTRVGNGRGGRFPPGRGGFRNDNFRGRGNYGGGGRGFLRNDYGNRGEFSSGRGRGPAGRGGDGYQPGRGRGGGRTWQNAEAAAP